MSELQTTDLSRRDFLKAAAGATIAVAAAGSVLPNVGAGKAFAATSLADGTYKVNANLFISKRIVLIGVKCFMLLSAKDGGGASVTGTETKTATYKDEDNNDLTRITKITFALDNMDGEYELGECSEYAAYQNPPFPMSMFVPGYLNWTATLAVDFSTAVAV